MQTEATLSEQVIILQKELELYKWAIDQGIIVQCWEARGRPGRCNVEWPLLDFVSPVCYDTTLEALQAAKKEYDSYA